CWSVALTFAQPLQTQVEACFVRDGPLDWLARNSSKPARGEGEVWVVQSTSSWAERHADSSAQEVIAELSQAMAEVLGQPLPEPGASQAQFWPQARPAEQLKWGALAAPRLNLYVCGDWCRGGGIENGWPSGPQGARALRESCACASRASLPGCDRSEGEAVIQRAHVDAVVGLLDAGVGVVVVAHAD